MEENVHRRSIGGRIFEIVMISLFFALAIVIVSVMKVHLGSGNNKTAQSFTYNAGIHYFEHGYSLTKRVEDFAKENNLVFVGYLNLNAKEPEMFETMEDNRRVNEQTGVLAVFRKK